MAWSGTSSSLVEQFIVDQTVPMLRERLAKQGDAPMKPAIGSMVEGPAKIYAITAYNAELREEKVDEHKSDVKK